MKGNSIFHARWRPGVLKARRKLLQGDLHIPKERIKTEELAILTIMNKLTIPVFWWVMFRIWHF